VKYNKQYKKVDRALVKKLHGQGLCDREVAEKLGYSLGCIHVIRKNELGLKANTFYDQSFRKYPSAKKLYSEYKLKHLSHFDLAKKYGMPLQTVQRKIGKHLMSLCRLDAKCPFKALLPEHGGLKN